MLGLVDRPRTDDDVGLVGQHRCCELGDVGTAVLVVCVGVDDDVGTQAQACIEAGHETHREAPIHRVAHHMVDTVLTSDFCRIVGRAVVDD